MKNLTMKLVNNRPLHDRGLAEWNDFSLCIFTAHETLTSISVYSVPLVL